MKIALLGSAPSSIYLAPFGDPSWDIWGCSPGLYAAASRMTEWFELHRWEPGIIGKPETQKAWLSPEYVAWMKQQPIVWMAQAVAEVPGCKVLPADALIKRWGSYFFTSTLAWMLVMAIEKITAARPDGQPVGEEIIGLWGVDMAATEEYGYQRAGCQHFLCLANMMGIGVCVPPESDLLRPMPLYGIDESKHWMIKNTVRLRELGIRRANAAAQIRALQTEHDYLAGAVDDLNYQMATWGESRVGMAPHTELMKFMKPAKED